MPSAGSNSIEMDVESCVFDAASAHGIYGEIYSNLAGYINVTNSLFENGGAAFSFTGDSYARISPHIRFHNVTSRDNRHQAFAISNFQGPITVEESTFLRNKLHVLTFSGVTDSMITIQRNSFLENGRDGIISVERPMFSRRGMFPEEVEWSLTSESVAAVTSILHNVLVNNTVGVTGGVLYYKDIDHRSKLECHDNIFWNQESVYEIVVGTAWKSGYYLDASNNDWGSADPMYITDRILDFYQSLR